MTQDSKVKRDECAVDIPEITETIGKEDIIEAVIQPSLSSDTSNAKGKTMDVPKRSDSATIVEAVVEACSTVPRWYFKANENAGVSEKEPTFECLKEYQPPVKANASDRYTNWRVPIIDCDPGRYMIVLGISTRDVRLDQIESITFNFSVNNGETYKPFAVITKRKMKNMASSDIEIIKWKLHKELHITSRNETKLFDMEVRISQDVLSPEELGFFNIHFMEVHPFQIECDVYDPYTRVHQPYLWSMDLFQSVDRTNGESVLSMQILFMAFSGDGNYVATLCVSDAQLVVDMWNIRHTRDSDIDPRASVTGLDYEEPPFHPTACARFCMPLVGSKSSFFELPYAVDVSWNATQIALTCYEVDSTRCGVLLQTFQDTFGVFRYDSHQPARAQSNLAALELSRDHLDCPGLKNYKGIGKFHITASQNQDPQNELYITCDGDSAEIYSAFRKWTHLRSIVFYEPRPEKPDLLKSFLMLRGLRGKHLVWTALDNDVISVWDIERGEIASTLIKDGHHHYWPLDGTVMTPSSDGSVIALCREGAMTIHRSDTGTVLGSCLLPDTHTEDCTVDFIHNDTKIMVISNLAMNKDFGRTAFGLVLDAESLSIVGWCSIPSSSTLIQLSPYADSSYNIYSIYQTTMECIRTQDLFIRPYSQRHSFCDEDCKDRLTLLKMETTEFTSGSGMDFRIIKKSTSVGEVIVVCMSIGVDSPIRTFTIPPVKGFSSQERPGNGPKYQTALIHGTYSRLLAVSRTVVMIWDLPETLDQDPVLLLAWSTHNTNGYLHVGRWFTCPHQQVYCQLKEKAALKEQVGTSVTVRLGVDHVFGPTYAEHFLAGLMELIDVYQSADEACRSAITRYASKYINRHPIKGNPRANVLFRICKSWKNEAHDVYKRFVADLLGPSNQRWVPRPESNPLPILLEKAEKAPRALGIVRIIIDCCIRNARDESNGGNDPDSFFLSPFVSCLHDILNQEAPLPDLASKALRELAYLPARCRSFIVDYHSIAHPPEFRWQFWKENRRLVYECKDPIFQLAYTTDGRDPRKDNFTRDLYVAPFDWLWIHKDTAKAPSKLSPEIRGPVQPPTWFSVLFHLILHKCKLSGSVKVECHNFELESFDNPALVALVEYKWNTFGYKYWATRFFFQCCFYILVLIAVFLQVYNWDSDALFGIFIAITVFSAVFLWLELTQLTKGWKHYLFSVYNIVDLAAFILPLVGSIDQLLILSGNGETTGNISILSFSVLFISLHFLFELRISRNVCQFVTIIIRIFREIRVFFLIFTGGILAFTIAILHLLHSCPTGECSTTAFPTHFYKAVSSTYFFMGGRYDSINDEMDSDNWAFHSMMIIYFFFTVILMLNVLIGLINLAFNDGDKTWRLIWLECRLRYVESAENITYHIPGFRDAYNWFPKEIYYSAIPKDVHKYFDEDDKDSRRQSSSVQPTAVPSLVGDDQKNSQWSTQRGIVALKEELKQEFKKELQEQLKAQQEAFEAQTRMLQEHISTFVSSSKT